MSVSKIFLSGFLPLFLLPVLLLIIVFDIDKWGTFFFDVTFTLVIQVVITLLLYKWIDTILYWLNIIRQRPSTTRLVKVFIFLGTTMIALPLVGQAFQRPLDIYDFMQTFFIAVVIIIWQRETFSHFLNDFRSSWVEVRKRPHTSDSTRTQKQPTPPLSNRRSNARKLPNPNNVNYQNLLMKARGDAGVVARLIEYEREHAPWKSEDELMETAIVRWERDNR